MDWRRLLIGGADWSFALEVVARVLVMYVVLLGALRLLGKRLSGQLTILEMALMITLGGIVSAPMVQSGKGVIVGCVLLVSVLGFQRVLGRAGVRSDRIELLVHGDALALVKDGVVQHHVLASALLTREALFATLRTRGVFQLGEVTRLYLEAYGRFSLFRADESKPGLSLLAPNQRATRYEAVAGKRACAECGVVVDEGHVLPCVHCGANGWAAAITETGS